MATATKNGVNRIASIPAIEKPKREKAAVHVEAPVPDKPKRAVTIAAPNMVTIALKIRGTTPYVQNKFSNKAREQMKAAQEAGSTGKKGKKRDAKDFQKCYEEAQYKMAGGGWGIPCGAFRRGLVSACRTVGFTMTHAKIGLFIVQDGKDADDIGTPLVKITNGKPRYFESPVRNDNGSADIRARPMWEEGWEATIRIRFDADMFTVEDATNLLARVGAQIGVGEGRADSKDSCGMGWGFFDVVN